MTLTFTLPTTHPTLACLPEELARLRVAYRADGSAGNMVTARVKAADDALARELVFPPRGGQHNQWYQCEQCQLGLQTVDATHHRCLKCGIVYTGEPYDDVLFSRQHGENLRGMRDCAWAYAITGETKYAAHARRVLLGYAERYGQYPYHTAGRSTNPATTGGGHIAEQTLNEATMMANDIAPSCDLIDATFSDAERTTIRDGLLLPMLRNIDRHKAGKSNWQSWHNAALFAGSIIVGDAALMRRSIDNPQQGFLFQMKESVSADGMWYENSWSYHAYTLQALTAHAEAARRCGIDLWAQEPLKKMFLLPPEYAMTDGSLPRFGDAVGRAGGAEKVQVEAAYAVYHDPRLLSMLPNRPSWESVLYGRDVKQMAPKTALPGRVFPGAGHAILRARGDAGLTAALTFGPFGGFHGHFDKLSFVFYGLGQELGVDPGRAVSQAYRLPIHTHWYRATIGHNAVVVDGKPQAPAEGTLLAFADTGNYSYAVADCTQAYPGVSQRRLLLLMPSYLLVVDDLFSPALHRYDWLYHNRGAESRCESAVQATEPEKNYPGQEYLQRLKLGRTDDLVRAIITGETANTCLIAAAAPGTDVRTGDGPCESVDDRVPLVMLTRHGATARFAVVLESVKAGSPSAIRAVTLEERDGALIMRVEGKKTDLVTLTTDNQVRVTTD